MKFTNYRQCLNFSRIQKYSMQKYSKIFNETDKILTAWEVIWPSTHKNGIIEFELKSFSFGFIVLFEFPIIDGKENTNVQKVHKYIHPGLNYRISCENRECPGFQNLMIIKRGYGEVIPNKDILKNKETNLLKCSICNLLINETTSIKAIILFQALAKIDYKLDTDYHPRSKAISKTFVAEDKRR